MRAVWQVFEELWKAQLNAEPTTATYYIDGWEENKGWVGTALIFAFGFLLVVLLLNLLIAVFAKTVDQVTADLDSHFKLKFGQVVMKAVRLGVAPRPLNLVRRAVLSLYSLFHFDACGSMAMELMGLQRNSRQEEARSATSPAEALSRNSADGDERAPASCKRASFDRIRKRGQSIFMNSRPMTRTRSQSMFTGSAEGEERLRAKLQRKSDAQKSSDFVARAFSPQVCLIPEEIVVYDAAVMRQAHGQVQDAHVPHNASELTSIVSSLTQSVAELRTVQHMHTERLEGMAYKSEQLSNQQNLMMLKVNETLATVNETLHELQSLSGPKRLSL